MFHNNRHENWESDADGVLNYQFSDNVMKCEVKLMF